MRGIIVLLFLLTCLAYRCQNNLHVFSGDGELFRVFINDRPANEIPQASVLVKNIDEDTVRLTIKTGFEILINETIYLLDKKTPVSGKEFSYRIEKNKKETRLVFSGMNDVQVLPDPLVPLKPVVDTSYKYKNNVLENYCELKNGKPSYFNNLPDGECVKPMPASYLNYMNILMRKAQVDDDKYLIAENTTKNNCISVAQLNKILSYIPYELEKLKLLRTAYFNLTDKQNKNHLDSSFTMESSKRELTSFFKNSEEYKLHSYNSCTAASDKTEVQKFAESLTVYSTDNERFSAFKKQYKDYCYTTENVKYIISKYLHDREKLDSAKLLYFYCVDKGNYGTLSDAFSYTTTSAELKDFVKKQTKQ